MKKLKAKRACIAIVKSLKFRKLIFKKMKSTKILFLLLATVTLAACGGGETATNQPALPTTDAEMQQQMALAAQFGQEQAISAIITRTMEQPCQPINLFNNSNPENFMEVNLINVTCEELDLPEIPPTQTGQAPATDNPTAITEGATAPPATPSE
jgi:hypothetical protein